MDPSTMWRLQVACQRNLVERQRIRKRLQHLTGKRSEELLCNDKSRHCQPDDWPCLTSFGVADAGGRMSAPAPQLQCQRQHPQPSSVPKRARQPKLKHICLRGASERRPLELFVVGHQLPIHPFPMPTTMATRSHHPSEHLQQQQQQTQTQSEQPHRRGQSRQAASRRSVRAEPLSPNDFVYCLSRIFHPYQPYPPNAQAQAQARPKPPPQPQPLSAVHVSEHLVLDARFMAELLDEILL